MMVKMILMATFFSLAMGACAQTGAIDSLKKKIQSAHAPAEKLKLILLLCEDGNLYKDTLDLYALMARKLANKSNDQRDQIRAELAIASSYINWGWTDSCIAILSPVIAKIPASRKQTRDLFYKASRQKAMAYGISARYKQALAEFYSLIASAEKYGDSLIAAENMNTIASIAIARKQPKEAMHWLRKGLSFSPVGSQSKNIVAGIYINTGDAHQLLHNLDSALWYNKKGGQIYRETNNLRNLAISLQKNADLLMETNQPEEAEKSLLQMLSIRRRMGTEGIAADDNIALANFYLNSGQPDRAIAICLKGLERGSLVSNEATRVVSNRNNIRVLYIEMLAKCYKLKGDSKQYQQTLEQLVLAKDTLYQINSAQAIAQMQAKYELQQKQTVITKQKLAISRKNYLIYGSALLLLLGAVIVWLAFRNIRQRQVAKLETLRAEEQRLAREAVMTAEENERKRIAADLHDNLGAYAASIASNIDMIEQLENRQGYLLRELKQNSVSIVSQLSDTIWLLNKKELPLTSISDRTKIVINRLRGSFPLVEMDIAEHIETDMPLPPVQAYHLLQIIQQAIANALKHSGCTKLLVDFSLTGSNSWEISIADNGHWKTEEVSQPGSGNGIGNMILRAKEASFCLKWFKEDTGTTVMITATDQFQI